MARELKTDYNELIKYFEKFDLTSLMVHNGYKEFLSVFHKKYYGYFTLITELETVIEKKDYSFLKETNSDLITCLFHLSTGNYKSSKLVLRSSIECFLKGFCLSWINDIDKEKSVFEIFNKVKNLNYFSNNPFNLEINKIQSIYKKLCLDVHTADELNMANISSLDFFPKYSDSESKEITKIVVKLIPIYCFLISNKFNSDFHKIHYSHKEIILMTIKKDFRPIIMNTTE